MPFTIPAPDATLVLSTEKRYQYIKNWKDCHKAGGELIDAVTRYSEDMILSLVLSFIAPFTTNSISSAREAVLSPPSVPKSEELVGQEILALTLASYMTLAKPVTTRNVAAFTKRWQSALSGQNITDLIPSSSWDKITKLAMVFHKIVTMKPDLRVEIVDRMLGIQKLGAEGAVHAQIKLVWSHASLKSVQLMDLFIKSHCRALEIPAVLDQAVLLHEAWEETKQDENYIYSRVRDPNCHPRLNQANFPDLYYASISYAKMNKLIGDNFQMSSGHTSAHTTMIDKYIKKMAASELGELSQEAKSKLTRLGYPVTTSGRRRAHQDDSEDEEDEEPQRRRSRK